MVTVVSVNGVSYPGGEAQLGALPQNLTGGPVGAQPPDPVLELWSRTLVPNLFMVLAFK